MSVDEAIARRGLRMVVVGGVPSPWGEAAKGILHIKGIDWTAVRLVYDSEPLEGVGGPAIRPGGDLRRRASRAPAGPRSCCWPSAWRRRRRCCRRMPPSVRSSFGLAHEICGEDGLGWSRRLQLIHAGLQDAGGFPPRVAAYLAQEVRLQPRTGAAAGARVTALLGMLAARLKAQKAAGSRYYVGNALTAVDVYSATFMALFAPLPHEQCAMDAAARLPSRRSMRRQQRRSTRCCSSIGT